MNREEMILNNLGLVRHAANKFNGFSWMYRIGFEEMVQIGTIGLIKAVDKFNPAKGVVFASFATRCITNEILIAMRSYRRHGKAISLETKVKDFHSDELTLNGLLETEADFSLPEVEEFLSRLDAWEKTVFELRKRHMTQTEIGRELGCDQAKISRTLSKIERRYREAAY